MKIVLFCSLALLFFTGSVSAYQVEETVVTTPYDIVPIAAEVSGTWQLGELTGYPVMYEWSLKATTTLQVQLRQLRGENNPLPLALMIVRKDDRGGGVTEVARQTATASNWNPIEDARFGVSFWESDLIERVVRPGVYRIEVSSPTNEGKYLLMLGADESPGYFATLANIRSTQRFFEQSFFALFGSVYVLYPIGTFLLLLGLWFTWRNRSRISHVA